MAQSALHRTVASASTPQQQARPQAALSIQLPAKELREDHRCPVSRRLTGRNYVTAIEAEDGVIGLGDATLNGRELAVASYLRDHVCPLLVGRDARRIEDTWQYLYRGAYWRRGPVTMTAIAAVDCRCGTSRARSRASRLRAARGAARDGVMVYCRASGSTLGRTRSDFQRHPRHRLPGDPGAAAIPGLAKTYGIARLMVRSTSRQRQVPQQDTWKPARLDFAPQVMALRREFGYAIHLLHDVHHRLTPIEAARPQQR